MAAPSFLESISPWGSRSTTPKPGHGKVDTSPPVGFSKQQGVDHAVTRRNLPSLREYPEDCPKPMVKWFYAFPKRKPLSLDKHATESKPLPTPKKYVGFSVRDSRSIEVAFQKLAEREKISRDEEPPGGSLGDSALREPNITLETGSKQQNTSINDATNIEKGGPVKVPVNEDFLFDVDVERRELAPAYWLGPIYDVRRGVWFYQEGSLLRPCDENLAGQLEDGYLKVKPWRYELTTALESSTPSRSRPTSLAPGQDLGSEAIKRLTNIKQHLPDNLKPDSAEEGITPAPIAEKFSLQTHRLFGAYMNSVVTYQDATVAWLLTDDFLSRMSSTVYQRFAGGGHLGGVKVVRGYSESSKTKEKKKEGSENQVSASLETERIATNLKRTPPPPSTVRDQEINEQQMQMSKSGQETEPEIQAEPRILTLERKMSSLVASSAPEDPAKQDEEVRKRDEDEIQEDYRDADGDDQGREIEHLILVTHGIGQRLGLRMESVNFIHDVNVLRKTLKSVYETSPDLQALNSEVEKLPKNCRVQVLPVVWRHLLDFPKQSFQDNRREQDLTDVGSSADDEIYPSLDDITVEGVPAVRNLITDLALDILLYQSAYREHIAGIVQRECNRIHELFVQRNPSFTGKVSLIGHSLGSAILFDILCRQKDTHDASPRLNRRRGHRSRTNSSQKSQALELNFEVEDFYCLGSPLGLYQMLKGRRITGRNFLKRETTESSLDSVSMDDPFLGASLDEPAAAKKSDIVSITVSSPKCSQLYNIFHNADCIAYRLEPLISASMSALKPQPLPYTKKGYFGAPGQGITGIGARVGQSVSGLWSNITSGVASSLLNRSLGLTGEGQISSSQSMAPPLVRHRSPSGGAGTNIIGGGVISNERERKHRLIEDSNKSEEGGQHPLTRIDAELETLYAGFQKRRKSQQNDDGSTLGMSAGWQEAEDAAKRLRREEAKVKALNGNGRVDYCIQE
ncbi:hypothetical protein MMC07_006499 [Pseudocyphellaria aurata]|nr:hypothetical protein [Pseudocyphellaria aurata]